MSKKEQKSAEYVQAYVPDTEELAVLVLKARGDNRTMAEFSRICKVKGPSTFSRIVNELIDKPVSDELLEAIAKNAADPEDVTLDMLMRANGKIPKDELAGGKVPTAENSRMAYKTQADTIKLVKEILLQDFNEKGKAVMLYPDLLKSMKMPRSPHSFPRLTDFALHIQGEDPLYWNFIVDFTDIHTVSLKMQERNITLLRESMRRYATLFLRDAWEPETMKDFKNTIVFIEEKAFKVFTEMIKDVKLNTWMSVMFVDTAKKIIKYESELTYYKMGENHE